MRRKDKIHVETRAGRLVQPDPSACERCGVETQLIALSDPEKPYSAEEIEWICRHCHYWNEIRGEKAPPRTRPAPLPRARAVAKTLDRPPGWKPGLPRTAEGRRRAIEAEFSSAGKKRKRGEFTCDAPLGYRLCRRPVHVEGERCYQHRKEDNE